MAGSGGEASLYCFDRSNCEESYVEGIECRAVGGCDDRSRCAPRVRARRGTGRASADPRELPRADRARAGRRSHAQPARGRGASAADVRDDERAPRAPRARGDHHARARPGERPQRHGDAHRARAPPRSGGAARVSRALRAPRLRARRGRAVGAVRAGAGLARVLRARRALDTASGSRCRAVRGGGQDAPRGRPRRGARGPDHAREARQSGRPGRPLPRRPRCGGRRCAGAQHRRPRPCRARRRDAS